jgi:hypothetical protein
MEKVHKLNNSEYKPSSESFSIYFKTHVSYFENVGTEMSKSFLSAAFGCKLFFLINTEELHKYVPLNSIYVFM